MAQLLFDRLMVQADDQGRLAGDPKVVRALCMPLIPMATPRKVATWLDQLAHEGMVKRYDGGGRVLLQLVNWWASQGSMKRSFPSRWPAPAGWEDRVRGVELGDFGGKSSPDNSASGGKSPPSRARSRTEPNPTEPNQISAEPLPPGEDEAAVFEELRQQVFSLWARHQEWTSWNGHEDEAKRITVWLSARPYPVEFWEWVVPQVPTDIRTFAFLTSPPQPGFCAWVEERYGEWRDDRYRTEKAALLATPPVVTFMPRAMP